MDFKDIIQSEISQRTNTLWSHLYMQSLKLELIKNRVEWQLSGARDGETEVINM